MNYQDWTLLILNKTNMPTTRKIVIKKKIWMNLKNINTYGVVVLIIYINY